MGAEVGGELMTREHFNIQIGRLIVLRNWPDDVEEWWRALQDVDGTVLEAACSHALKTRTFFPMPAELRADCDAVRLLAKPLEPVYPKVQPLDVPRVLEIPNKFDPDRPLRIPVTREWRHDCLTCEDSGWESFFCGPADDAKPWQTVKACERVEAHASHEFVAPCGCRDWNPTIRRKKEAAMKYSQAPEKVNA